MKESLRKPRVFLSHSKKDIDFVKRLENDLRACQCEIWIDEIEIRHGKPCLDEIFSAGIPSCEIVLCYITPNSAQSPMVRKEIDARLIEKMQDEHVTILPYVSSDEVRIQLRSDLQTLQIPVLNGDTYTQMLPRIVAQVWRSHLDWVVSQAIQSERVRRLELELKVHELQAQHSGKIFSDSEDADFSAIWSWMDKEFHLDIEIIKTNEKEKEVLQTVACEVNLRSLYRRSISRQQFTIDLRSINYSLKSDIAAIFGMDPKEIEISFELSVDFNKEFLKFGFLSRSPRQNTSDSFAARFLGQKYELVLTEKFDRFNYWLMQTQNIDDCTGPIVSIANSNACPLASQAMGLDSLKTGG
jgi:hypothetical protein